MLEVRRLRLLREFAIRGTIAGVAETLNYSPSAVSQQLTILEKEAGTVLLQPAGRGLELTPAAEALISETETILSQLEQAEATLRNSMSEVSGTIRMAVFQTAVMSFMPEALRILASAHPLLRIELVQHEPETALHETWAHGFDIVVAEQYPGHAAPHHPGLDRQLLVRDRIQLALPPPHTADEQFDRVHAIADAASLPWVMEPRGAACRHWVEQTCRVVGFEPDLRYETADVQAHLRLVETGNAAALVTGLALAGSNAQVRLVELPDNPSRSVFTSVRAASVDHPAVIAVRTTLDDVATSLQLERDTRL